MSRTWIFDMTDLDAPALIGTYERDRKAVLGAFLGWCDGLHNSNAGRAIHEND